METQASPIVLNSDQQRAVQWAKEGRSFVLTGAAGTGKTTAVQEIIEALVPSLDIVTFRDPYGGSKDEEAKAAIACCSFTNRAVNNMLNSTRKHKPHLIDSYDIPICAGNFITIHKLLEYYPEYFFNLETGKESMRFVPNRDGHNKLPSPFTLVIEEASMLDVHFSNVLADALVKGEIRLIILGDINQLPPVFGDSILNYALKFLPVIDLTHVYRQALDSPIIRQAHNVLKNITPSTDGPDFQVGTFEKAAMGDVRFGKIAASTLQKLYMSGSYNPNEDIILSPYNVEGSGTETLNQLVATWIDKLPENEGRHIYEIVSGFKKNYYAVGDRVYDGINKMEGIITGINVNGTYYGTKPQPDSPYLTRFGHEALPEGVDDSGEFLVTEDGLNKAQYDYTNLDLGSETTADVEDRVQAASHTIEVTLESGEGISLSTAGEINSLALGYALTTHKAQGCEWPRVIVVLHNSHKLANREWIYTAITRAQKGCTILASNEALLTRVVGRQRVKGNTINDKITNFNISLEKKIREGKAPVRAKLLDCIGQPEALSENNI